MNYYDSFNAFVVVVVESYERSFDDTINTLPMLSSINEIHSQKMKNMKMTSPDFKLPELHKEVFDGSGP